MKGREGEDDVQEKHPVTITIPGVHNKFHVVGTNAFQSK